MADFLSANMTKIYQKYGREYAAWFMAMLTNPSLVIVKSREAKNKGKQGEYLLTVFAISIFLGATLGALIPDRPPIQGRAVVFIVVSLLWLFLSVLVHYFCRIIGGKEDAQISVSLMAQNLAFAYVGNNFLTLLIMWAKAAYKPVDALLTGYEFDSPGAILFGLQFLMLLYLVPMTVSRAHGFKGLAWFLVAIFAGAFGRANIDGQTIGASLAKSGALTWPVDSYWRLADNSRFALPTPDSMIAFGIAADEAYLALRKASWAHKDAIAALTSPDEIAAYDIAVGW